VSQLVVARVPIAKFESGLVAGARVINVLPNTPALVGTAIAFALGKPERVNDGGLAHRLFSAIGIAFQLKGLLLAGATEFSGARPAYVSQFTGELGDGGVAAGLPLDPAAGNRRRAREKSCCA
jgi:pyrroline-5-carboxylate reductase